MARPAWLGCIAVAFGLLLAQAASAANFDAGFATTPCSRDLTKNIPARSSHAPTGSAVTRQVMRVRGSERDAVVTRQILSGNLPSFLRDLVPVNFGARLSDGKEVRVTICVMPDYLAVGGDRDFVRLPMGLPAAAEIADGFGFVLPTTRMVDAIYAQAKIHLTPRPMRPSSQMTSTEYLVRHNSTVEGQRARFGNTQNELVAGQKKDLVLSNRLRAAPGRVAIYGWHRRNGKPIQPLSTVHGAHYADYSHGVRLVSATAFVDGKPQSLTNLMQNPELARIISSEGPIAHAHALLTSLYR